MLKVFLLVALIAFAYSAPAEQTVDTEAKVVDVEKSAEDTATKDETLKTDESSWVSKSWGWPSYSYYPHYSVRYYPTYYRSAGWSGYGGWYDGHDWNNGWGSYWYY